jgi:hypothetical protein
MCNKINIINEVRTRSLRKFSARQFSADNNWTRGQLTHHTNFLMQTNLTYGRFDPNKFTIETNFKYFT